MPYEPKRIVALTTINLQDLGLGFVQLNVFSLMRRVPLL